VVRVEEGGFEMMKMTERQAEIRPIKSKLRLSILEDEDVSKINQTALSLLEDVGVKVPWEKALKIFADGGAHVDFEKKIVKIPGQLVTDALKKAPRRYDLCGRRPELDAHIGSKEGTYFYCSGEAPKIVDLETGERRRAVKKDVERMARIADYLSIVSLVWPTVSAGDKGETAPVHAVEACFNNTEKHVQTESVMDGISAGYAIEMASVIAGGRERLRERPNHSILVCAIAPLAHDRGGLEAALAYAEAGLPVGFMSMPTLGLTAPPYQAGALATGMAEILSGCVLTQIAHPGTPNYISIIPAVIDPRSGNYFMASPYAQTISAASVQLAHSHGLPIASCMSFGGSGHKLNSWQVGMENMYVQLLAIMAGSDMAFGPSGMMEAVSVLDMRRILFDREIVHVMDILTDGIEVRDDTLAIDMIRRVGHGGMFLTEKRTVVELPRLWPQSILHEMPKPGEGKYRDPVEVAHEAVEWILEHHRPAPLPEEVRRELRRIVAAADQDKNLKREIRGTT
jgi:trimethylamine--corrinoid protein Co-methyltransferase